VHEPRFLRSTLRPALLNPASALLAPLALAPCLANHYRSANKPDTQKTRLVIADPQNSANTTPEPAPTSAAAEVKGIHGWRRVLLFPLGLALRAWGASLRFEASPESLRHLTKTDEPVAFVLWHNRLILTSEIFRRYRRSRTVYGLVSASKDGAWLSAFFSLVGIRTVRGSSSKLGREAVNALVEVMRAGNDIGITPDGPRGPLYDFKAGGLIVARRVHAPLLLLGAAFESSWQLRSWDRFYLPKPFSRVFIRCAWVPTTDLSDREKAAHTLRERLLAMNPDTPDSLHEPIV
jgi:lysophospholipid acyltransferase (LPLAT)-like uncharacterized protein